MTITGFFNHWRISFLWFLLSDAAHSKAVICLFTEFKTEINLGLGLKHGVKKSLAIFLLWVFNENVMKSTEDSCETPDRRVMVTCSGENPWKLLILDR